MNTLSDNPQNSQKSPIQSAWDIALREVGSDAYNALKKNLAEMVKVTDNNIMTLSAEDITVTGERITSSSSELGDFLMIHGDHSQRTFAYGNEEKEKEELAGFLIMARFCDQVLEHGKSGRDALIFDIDPDRKTVKRADISSTLRTRPKYSHDQRHLLADAWLKVAQDGHIETHKTMRNELIPLVQMDKGHSMSLTAGDMTVTATLGYNPEGKTDILMDNGQY